MDVLKGLIPGTGYKNKYLFGVCFFLNELYLFEKKQIKGKV
jgi:hypothetical protein